MKQYPMQYADRLTGEEEAFEILESEQFITVATVDEDGYPYCVPLSYVVERGWGEIEGKPEETDADVVDGAVAAADDAATNGAVANAAAAADKAPLARIYIHTLKGEGHKMEDWARDGRVWASVVTEVKPLFIDTFFTTAFASAMVAGTIRQVENPVAIKKALVKLCMKYMPEMKAKIGFAIQDEFDKTAVWCIDVNYMTGKAGHRGE